jgi:hypothetical protein
MAPLRRDVGALGTGQFTLKWLDRSVCPKSVEPSLAYAHAERAWNTFQLPGALALREHECTSLTSPQGPE